MSSPSSATWAMSAGMAYEAMVNNAGALDALIVILNDNDMSIAPPSGDEPISGAAGTRARPGAGRSATSAQADRPSGQARRQGDHPGGGEDARAMRPAARCSRSSASSISAPSIGTIWNISFRS